jgi:hypothetical protein
MLFGEEEKAKENSSAGRWSTPASLATLTERLQDTLVARNSFGSKFATSLFFLLGSGSGSIKEAVTSAKALARSYAPGAYDKASQAKHAALDWITNMTANSSSAQEQDGHRN